MTGLTGCSGLRPEQPVRPLLPNGLGQRFEKLAHAAGHPDATLHRLRHTIGTYLVAQGKILQACARLRHRDSTPPCASTPTPYPSTTKTSLTRWRTSTD